LALRLSYPAPSGRGSERLLKGQQASLHWPHRFLSIARIHSYLKAIMRSVLLARRASTHAAQTATAPSSAATAAKVMGSVGLAAA